MTEPTLTLGHRLRTAFIPVQLTPDQEQRIGQEEQDSLRSRLLAVLPLMIGLHIVHLFLTMPWSPLRAMVDDPVVHLWADWLLLVHVCTGIAVLVPLGLAFFRRASRWVGPLTAMTYLLHGAAVAGIDQLNSGTILPYMGYALVIAVVVILTFRQAVVVYTLGGGAFMGAILLAQPDAATAISSLPTGLSIAVPCVVIVLALNNSRRNNFFLREVTAEQRRNLERLNNQLEERVQEQVAALVARSNEVETLNEQLSQRVRDRSRELANALRELAKHEPGHRAGLTGTVLAGRFQVGAELGAGGMGVVYEADDQLTGNSVAVKVMRNTVNVGADALGRFLREAETVSSVKHASIVKMLHVDVTPDGRLFQVQDRVHGMTLSVWLNRLEYFDVDVALTLVRILADALSAAHNQGIVHRDVKPANIMLLPTAPGLMLLDFGVAKMPSEATLTQHTAIGALLGTPAYMGPELWGGVGAASPAADIYAVGVVAFRMLAGRLPKRGGDGAVVSFDTVSMLGGDIGALLDRTLAPNPVDRPSAQDLASALGRHPGVDLAQRVARCALGPAAPPAIDGDHSHLSFI
jgi:hypothetical protein